MITANGRFTKVELRDSLQFMAQFALNFEDFTAVQRCRIIMVLLVMFGQAHTIKQNKRRNNAKMDETTATTSTELHKCISSYAGRIISIWLDNENDHLLSVVMNNGLCSSTVRSVFGLQEHISNDGIKDHLRKKKVKNAS
jgi:predicted Na+-dependent transporter